MKIPTAWRTVEVGDLLNLKASTDEWRVIGFGLMHTFDEDNHPHAERTVVVRSTRTSKKREVRVDHIAG